MRAPIFCANFFLAIAKYIAILNSNAKLLIQRGERAGTCMMATRRTSPRRPTAMEPMAMAAGPSANLSTRPSAAKHGPHASTFSCCAMNNPACHATAENDMHGVRKLSVVNHYSSWLGRHYSYYMTKKTLFFMK